jgi:hypothetical protein
MQMSPVWQGGAHEATTGNGCGRSARGDGLWRRRRRERGVVLRSRGGVGVVVGGGSDGRPGCRDHDRPTRRVPTEIEAVAAAAPVEISEEVDTILSATRDQFDAFRQMDDLSEEQLAATFDDPAFGDETFVEIDAAQEAANAYALEECGIDLG